MGERSSHRSMRQGWWVGALCMISCATPGTFACQDAEDCSNGVCQPTGYCSFPDNDCPSGQRYGDLAEAGLAGQCVSEAEGGSGGPQPTSDVSGGSSGASPTTGGTASTESASATATGMPPDSAADTDPDSDSDSDSDPTATPAECADGRSTAGELCFDVADPITVEAPFHTNDLAAGDFDDNGTADLLLVADVEPLDGNVDDALCLVRADGLGGFIPEDDCEDLGADATRVRILDGNGDGRLEALVITTAQLQVWRWLGGAILNTPVALPLQGGDGFQDFALGDFDSDGHTDVVFSWTYGHGMFLGRTANQTWALDASSAMEVEGIPGEGAAGVGLLRADALGGQTDEHIAFFANQYASQLQAAAWDGTTFSAAMPFEWDACEGVATGALQIASGDFDGDGPDDLVVSCANGAIAVMLWNGSAFESHSTALAGARNPVVGDADGDGSDEILVPSSLNVVVLFDVDASGVASPVVEFDAGGPDPAATLADLNEDGVLDVASAANITDTADGGQLRVWLQTP